jgi:putative transposase
VRRFFDKAVAENSAPETVSIDKSGSNLAALQRIHVSPLERETQGKPDVVLK